MTPPNPSMRNWVVQLLAAGQTAAGPSPNLVEVEHLNDRLKARLIRLAGRDGFASLEQRALMLAQSDLPELKVVRIGTDGCLTGLELMDPDIGIDAAMAITTHLLGILVSVIGERLTLRLLHETWPDSGLDG